MFKTYILLFFILQGFQNVISDYTCKVDGSFIVINKKDYQVKCNLNENIIGCKKYSKYLDDNIIYKETYICNGDTFLLCKDNFNGYYCNKSLIFELLNIIIYIIFPLSILFIVKYDIVF